MWLPTSLLPVPSCLSTIGSIPFYIVSRSPTYLPNTVHHWSHNRQVHHQCTLLKPRGASHSIVPTQLYRLPCVPWRSSDSDVPLTSPVLTSFLRCTAVWSLYRIFLCTTLKQDVPPRTYEREIILSQNDYGTYQYSTWHSIKENTSVNQYSTWHSIQDNTTINKS